MKTGIGIGSCSDNYFPETFFIIYLVLSGILRRCAFKDCVLYSKHNELMFDQELFDTGVIFNLFSEYGVGKSLEPLVYELLTTLTLDPDKYVYNIFFNEIVRLTYEMTNIIRIKDPNLESEWMIKYAMSMESVKDAIASERILRMADILYEIPNSDTDSTNDSDDNDNDNDNDNNDNDDNDNDNDNDNENVPDDIPDVESEEHIPDDTPDDIIDDDSEEHIPDDVPDSDSEDDDIPEDDIPDSDSESDDDNNNSDNDNSDDNDNNSDGDNNNDNNNDDDNDNNDDDNDNNDDDNDNNKILCYCLFCHEYRKYHKDIKTRDVNQLISNAMIGITKNKLNLI